MVHLIIFVLFSYGLTAFVVDSSLLYELRAWLAKYERVNLDDSRFSLKSILLGKLSEGINCYQCVGFHTGWFLWWLGFRVAGDSLIGVFASCFVASASCMIISNLTYRDFDDNSTDS